MQSSRFASGVPTTRFGVGNPARGFTFEVSGSPAAHGYTVRYPACAAIPVTESDTAVASAGTTVAVEIDPERAAGADGRRRRRRCRRGCRPGAAGVMPS